MKYDDASWHYGGNFPKELSNGAGATHIGMFLTWVLLNGMASELLIQNSQISLQKLRNKEITGSDFLIIECDEKLTSEDLNEQGNSFAKYYYNGEGGYGQYLDDYDRALCANLESIYYVADTWENYMLLAPYIDKAFEQWRSCQ